VIANRPAVAWFCGMFAVSCNSLPQNDTSKRLDDAHRAEYTHHVTVVQNRGGSIVLSGTNDVFHLPVYANTCSAGVDSSSYTFQLLIFESTLAQGPDCGPPYASGNRVLAYVYESDGPGVGTDWTLHPGNIIDAPLTSIGVGSYHRHLGYRRPDEHAIGVIQSKILGISPNGRRYNGYCNQSCGFDVTIDGLKVNYNFDHSQLAKVGQITDAIADHLRSAIVRKDVNDRQK